MFTLAPCDVTQQLENTRVVWQGAPRDLQLGQRANVIEVSLIEIFGTRKMRFTCVRAQVECRLNGRFCSCEPRRSMIVSEEVEIVMRVGQQAISLKE